MDPALASLLGVLGGGLLTWALSEVRDRRQTRERRSDADAERLHQAERENVQWVRAAHVEVYSRYLGQTADVALALIAGNFDRNEVKASLDDARSAVATLTLLAPEEVRAAVAEHHQLLSLIYVTKLRAIDAGDDQEQASKFEQLYLSSLDDELEAREQVQSAMRASLGVAAPEAGLSLGAPEVGALATPPPTSRTAAAEPAGQSHSYPSDGRSRRVQRPRSAG